jgi:hypothetical protein
MDIPMSHRLTSPDVNLFIYAAINKKYCKQYFDDLKNSRFKGLFLESVGIRLNHWLLGLIPTITAFFIYCSTSHPKLNEKIYLQHVNTDDNPDQQMKRFKRYSNIILQMLNTGKNLSNLQGVYDQIKRSIDINLKIFAALPNKIVSLIDSSYTANVITELKSATNNEFHDEEDAEHLAQLRHYITVLNNWSTILFVTDDKGLRKFSEDIINWCKYIAVVNSQEFYEGLPDFIT